MRHTAAVAPFLLALLVWFSLRVIHTDEDRFDQALTALDRFAMTESALQRDVLTARAGMLRDYDPLVQEVGALYASLDRLRGLVTTDAELSSLADKLDESVHQQETLIEHFKSDNALLQNSLAYFEQFSIALGAPGRGSALAPAVSALAGAMLHLTLDTSPEAARDVDARLVELAQQPAATEGGGMVQALIAHGRLLHDMLPATDSVLKALFAAPVAPAQAAIRAGITAHQTAARRGAQQSRLLLLVTSVVLLGLLVHLGFMLRERARRLQRRAMFEHVIADISTRFISAPSHEIKARVERALSELADRIGADRAYLILRREPAEVYGWTRHGLSFPPGWPDRVLALAGNFSPDAEGIIHIPRVEHLALAQGRDTFVAAGLRSWTCVRRTDALGVVGMLGFDNLQRHPVAAGEMGLLRMAFDAIYNALNRAFLEHERGHLENRLQQARRMETVGALASGIAHNFNNIVGAILGYTEMAEAGTAVDRRLGRNLAGIRRAGERARDLIDQILTLGRVRKEARDNPVDVSDLLVETASLLRASLPPGVTLVVPKVIQPVTISGEPAQLQQVIINLCNNAAQAMDENGCVAIDVAVHAFVEPRPLSHGVLSPGRYACLAVNDTGRGMDESTKARIFEPFFTTRAAGNGLGLATVQEIVREHGGMMNVDSAPGAGSRFEVWLPCVASTSMLSGGDAATPLRGEGEVVLVIDQDQEQLFRQEDILAALGYEPVGFTHAGDMLAACRSTPYRFDALIIGNLGVPASAPELATTVRELVPGLPILLATGSADAIRADVLLAAGVTEVVRLPFMSSEIAAVLGRRFKARMVAASPVKMLDL